MTLLVITEGRMDWGGTGGSQGTSQGEEQTKGLCSQGEGGQ